MSQWLARSRRGRRVLALTAALALGALGLGGPVSGAQAAQNRYLVVFAGSYALDGSYALGGDYALNHASAVQAITAAGGSIANDLSKQIGVMVVESSNANFYALLKSYALVEEIGQDFGVQALPSMADVERYALTAERLVDNDPGDAPDPADDPGETLQWDMQQIRTELAHDTQAGIRAVDVGVLDSGIDGRHLEFDDDGIPGGTTNVDCSRGRNSVSFLPAGPGVGTPDPCTDNQFHGTHVAGTIAMQSNGLGLVGVAPNVTLVPVKVCDATGYCYASAVVDGITYAGDQRFDVINMSFFVDDNEFQQSTEFKCMSDPAQRAFRKAVERAIQYARNQGVTPIAALGNSDEDLAHPTEPNENECDVVPAETQGVVGTMALGRDSGKAGYSNYGTGATDVAAPGGNGTTGDCTTTIPSAFPGNLYVCIQGTSMASPHAAGVAALIISQFGTVGSDGDVKLPPTSVEAWLQSSAVDIGQRGYDECFGNGRIDALRAVNKDTSRLADPSAPHCPEYAE